MTKRIKQPTATRNSAMAVLGDLRSSSKSFCRRSLSNHAVPLFLGRLALPTMVLFATVLIGTTVARGQELKLRDVNFSVSSASNGWWSTEAADAHGAPHLELGSYPTGRDPFGLLLSVEPKPVNSPVSEDAAETPGHAGADFPSANLLSEPGLSQETPELASLLNRSSEEIRFFLYPLEAEYVLWQSRLMDSETPTAERGVLVYPLAQVNLIDARVPISLYSPRLRGSAPNTVW